MKKQKSKSSDLLENNIIDMLFNQIIHVIEKRKILRGIEIFQHSIIKSNSWKTLIAKRNIILLF